MKNKNVIIPIVIASGIFVITLIQIWLPYVISTNSDNQESETIIGAKQMGSLVSYSINLLATLITPFIWAAVYISIRYLIFRDREMGTSHFIILCISIIPIMILATFIFRWPY